MNNHCPISSLVICVINAEIDSECICAIFCSFACSTSVTDSCMETYHLVVNAESTYSLTISYNMSITNYLPR